MFLYVVDASRIAKTKRESQPNKKCFFFGDLDSPILPVCICFSAKNFDVFFCYVFFCWTVGGRFCCWNMLCYTYMRQNSNSICFFEDILILFCTITHFSCHTQHSILYANCCVSIQPELGVDRPPTTQNNTPVLLLLLLYTNNLAKNCKRPKKKQSTRAQIVNRQR